MRDLSSAGRPTLPPEVRLDGETILVTGASRGLGLALCIELALRGARLVMLCRSRIEEAPTDVRAKVPDAEITVIPVDLAKPDQVDGVVARVVDEDVRLDRVVLNAGAVTQRARPTDEGLDTMVHVNFVASAQLTMGLREHGRLAEGARVVFVGSDAHRFAEVDLQRWSEPEDYGTSGVLKAYGSSKRLLHTWVEAFATRADELEVLHLCPGGIATDIAREAPGWLRPLVGPVMRSFFPTPESVANWVVWVVASPEHDGRTGVYFHLGNEKPPGDGVRDEAAGTQLWTSAEAVIRGFAARREE